MSAAVVRSRSVQLPAIPAEYVSKPRNKDRAYHNTAPGEQGPMEAALRSLGGCTGLVGGFYGEIPVR